MQFFWKYHLIRRLKLYLKKYSPFDLGNLPNFKREKNRAVTTRGQQNIILYCLKSGCRFALSVVKVTQNKEESHLSMDTFTFMEWFSSGNLTRSLKILSEV